jgi:hypothetical protein
MLLLIALLLSYFAGAISGHLTILLILVSMLDDIFE